MPVDAARIYVALNTSKSAGLLAVKPELTPNDSSGVRGRSGVTNAGQAATQGIERATATPHRPSPVYGDLAEWLPVMMALQTPRSGTPS